MLKWLILFGVFFFVYRKVAQWLRSLFVAPHQQESSSTSSSQPNEAVPHYDKSNVVDVGYREVHRDQADSDSDTIDSENEPPRS